MYPQINSNQFNSKLENPPKNLSEQNKEKTNSTHMSHKSGYRTRITFVEGECSHHCASPDPLRTLPATVVQKVDNAIHRVNHYPLDSAIDFAITYPLGSDLSGGWPYPPFEQL